MKSINILDFKNLSQVDAYRLAKQTLSELYVTDDGKKFVHHLIYAFNADPLKFIIFSKANLFDCLSKSVLRTVSTKDQPLPDDLRDLYSRIPNSTNDDKSNLELELYNKVGEYIKSASITRCALRSDHTNKILGTDEYQALIDFSIDQCNAGNDTVFKMIKYLRPDLLKLINRPKKSNKPKTKSKKSNGVITDSQLEALKNKFNCK